MFQNITNDIDYYIYEYKATTLNKSFADYFQNSISYQEYYGIYNQTYIDLILIHNRLMMIC